MAWQRALLATCEAEWARAQGDLDPDGWLAVVAAWAAGYPYPLATARWRAAEALLARRGDRALAADLLRQGHAAAVALGARPSAASWSAWPGWPGGAAPGRPRRGGRRRAAGDPDGAALGLTARELEVLALVAEGRSNRQVADALFISAKTASVHVSNILAKLGVASRVEAAAVAHRLGLLAPPPGP